MKRMFFNTAGPQQPENHYSIDPLSRIQTSEIVDLIDQQRYFILHAPRQTGKTTALLALMRHLNKEGRYRALYVNIESAQAYREDVEKAMGAIAQSLTQAAINHLQDHSLEALSRAISMSGQRGNALHELISHLCRADPAHPLVLFIDEIDALIGDTLISVLRQIRSGYADRPHAFPQSMILCGVRDVRDYRIHSDRSKEIITGGSAFNIKAESLRLGNFSQAEVSTLYALHTHATGQIFTTEALDLAWEYSQGQPWLVNALAHEVTWRMKEMRDFSVPITGEIMRQAKERLIVERATHLDILIDKLREARIRRVIQPLLQSEETEGDLQDDDVQYTYDMGLIRIETGKRIRIANAIYREIIPRELTANWQYGMSNEQDWYVTPEGLLDIHKLLKAFQQFFREHSESWLERFDYKEAGPQLLLQAFLQRIVNGGGRIEREYGLGRGRTDLYITWPATATPTQRIVLELKIRREKDGRDAIRATGLQQTLEYMQRCGADEGHLLIFDQDAKRGWDEKISCQPMSGQFEGITVWGC